jgi:PPOX class probable F420-dependent enzyme
VSPPAARRPDMPGYGILDADEGSGLLPWSWAEERLRRSHDYWLATVRPDDGRPHLMPVWGMWDGAGLWFSCSGRSRKTRNLLATRRCSVSTDDAIEPVVLEGIAELVDDPAALRTMLDLENEKYGTDYGIEMVDPAVNASFRVRPERAFGIDSNDFLGSPTRWDLA